MLPRTRKYKLTERLRCRLWGSYQSVAGSVLCAPTVGGCGTIFIGMENEHSD